MTTIRYIEENVIEDRSMLDFVEKNGIDLGQ